jgi:hypothetical protein
MLSHVAYNSHCKTSLYLQIDLQSITVDISQPSRYRGEIYNRSHWTPLCLDRPLFLRLQLVLQTKQSSINYKDRIICEILSKYLGLQHRCISFGLLYIVTVLEKIQNNISGMSRSVLRWRTDVQDKAFRRLVHVFEACELFTLKDTTALVHPVRYRAHRWCRRGEGGRDGTNYRGLTVRGPTMLHTFRYSKLSQKAIVLNQLF